MSLSFALTSAVSSLSVNQEALSLVAQNIANANSDGYVRREISLENNVVSGIPAGVRVADVRRAVDGFLVESARAQISEVGRSKITSEYMDRLQLFLGQPSAENSLNVAVDDFFLSLSDLSNNPEQSFFKASVADKAVFLADKIQSLARDVETLRFQADQEINSQVDTANELLSELFTVNNALKEVGKVGGDKNALLDQRDIALSNLGEIINSRITLQDGGVTLFVEGAEILNTNSQFQLSYNALASVDSFVQNAPTSALNVILLDGQGNPTTSQNTLVSSTGATEQKNLLRSGSLLGLMNIRDVELPKILAELDEFAKTITDSFNAIHNNGSGFPPASELTGASSFFGTENRSFSGNVRIAVVDANGSPVSDEFGQDFLPMNFDLDNFDGGSGAGTASALDIVKEINNYFGPPPINKASIADIDDIRIAAVSSSITSVEASATVEYMANPDAGDTITIDGTAFTFVATGTPSSGTNIEAQATISATVAEISRYLNTYTGGGTVRDATYTSSGSTLTITNNTSGTAGNAFTIATDLLGSGGTASINGAAAGGAPSTTLINGANVSGSFEFDFEMTNLSATDYTFEVLSIGINNGAAGMSNSFDPYIVKAGTRERSDKLLTSNDSIVVDMTGSTQAEGGVHVITAQVRLTSSTGIVTTDTISYEVTIPDPNEDIKNNRFAATAISGGGDATLTAPASTQRFLTASFVNSAGNIAQSNEKGFLKIASNNPNGYRIVIEELDSKELGNLTNASTTATNKGFSNFFGLNNFFDTGDTLNNSAINMSVREAFINDASLIATGNLVLSNQPSDTTANPVYTYEIGMGSNQNIAALANLQNQRVSFDSAGAISGISTSFVGYASEIISSASFISNKSDNDVNQQMVLFNAFNDRLTAQGGVNIDEELANTIKFQNNYQASARMISVISELFDTLLQTF